MPEGSTLDTVNDPTRNPKSLSFDPSHPYHLTSSDAPGTNLINTTFDGRGVPGRRRSILIALSAKKKLGFINGSCKSPDMDSPEFLQWSCYNDMVTAWLLNSLSKEIADSVMYLTSAKEIWDSLQQRFGKSDGTKLYHLQKELSVKEKLAKSVQDQRLIHFLMGLNDVYTQARESILMINPLPSMNIVYSLLLQDESQREVHMSAQVFSDLSSLMVTNQGKPNFKGPGQSSRSQNYPKPANYPQKFVSNQAYPQKFANSQPYPQKFVGNQSRTKGKRGKYDPNATCTYCLKTGHWVDDCYRLIGFPDDCQFNKGKNTQNRAKTNAGLINEENQESNDPFSGQETGNNFQHFTK
ncbi:uncharacterized protein LOC132628866 [Lycium barbarum]|uniref:uncharacterized protein LOC132628866 n=1 Tax=Lycium barbarum TaxID=112863 RepID=UPI00293E3F01|nr:uncharacterized protein LOC132628866 [Lycium barbarum]